MIQNRHKVKKTFSQRLSDLKKHATRLNQSCDRFRNDHNLIEINTIASCLRLLTGDGKGNNLLFVLARYKEISFYVFILNNYMEMRIREIDKNTGDIIQDIDKRKLMTKPISDQPTLPIVTTRSDYGSWLQKVKFTKWLKEYFLMDWEVPNNENRTPKITRLTPKQLIKYYADTEGSHSDDSFHKEIGSSFEEITEEYIFNGKKIIMPVVYNYLFQIGQVTAEISLGFIKNVESERSN